MKRSLRDFVADSRMKPLRHISMENNELCKREKKGMKIVRKLIACMTKKEDAEIFKIIWMDDVAEKLCTICEEVA